MFISHNIEPCDSSLDVKQISELPPEIPDIELSESEDSIWNELPYTEKQTQPTLPLMPSATSVMETPHNVSSSSLTNGSNTFMQCIRISKNGLEFSTTTQ